MISSAGIEIHIFTDQKECSNDFVDSINLIISKNINESVKLLIRKQIDQFCSSIMTYGPQSQEMEDYADDYISSIGAKKEPVITTMQFPESELDDAVNLLMLYPPDSSEKDGTKRNIFIFDEYLSEAKIENIIESLENE